MSDPKPMDLQRLEFEAADTLATQIERLNNTPIVDDDYPMVRHHYEGALQAFIKAIRANGRLTEHVIPAALMIGAPKEPVGPVQPEAGQYWRHHSGRYYLVAAIANVSSVNAAHLPHVVYNSLRGPYADPKRTWSRRLSDWHDKFTGPVPMHEAIDWQCCENPSLRFNHCEDALICKNCGRELHV